MFDGGVEHVLTVHEHISACFMRTTHLFHCEEDQGGVHTWNFFPNSNFAHPRCAVSIDLRHIYLPSRLARPPGTTSARG